MILHDIDIHIFMPMGITGPGLELENASKPAVTHKIEEGDAPASPEQVAQHLENGGLAKPVLSLYVR